MRWAVAWALSMGPSLVLVACGDDGAADRDAAADVDAGPDDAGQRDAGQRDAGRDDAGRGDAGQRDAGPAVACDGTAAEVIAHLPLRNTSAVAIDGDLLVVSAMVDTDFGEELRVVGFDVSDPSAPVQLWSNSSVGLRITGEPVLAMTMWRGYLHVLHTNGWFVLDLTHPTGAPVFNTNGLLWEGDLQVVNDRAYLAGADGVFVYDAYDVSTLPPLGSFDLPRAVGLEVVAGRVYAVTGGRDPHETSGLHILDATAPSAPTELGSLPFDGTGLDVVVREDLAYVTRYGADRALTVVDVSEPATPTELGSLPGSATAGIALSGDLAVVAWVGVLVVDVADPHAPSLAAHVELGYPVLDVVTRDDVAFAVGMFGDANREPHGLSVIRLCPAP